MSDTGTIYYATDNTKLAFRECGQVGGLIGGAVLALGKVFGIRVPTNEGIPWPAPLRSQILDEKELSPEAKAKLAPVLKQCRELGFAPPIYHTLKARLLPSDLVIASCLHSEGEAVARVVFWQIFLPNRTVETLHSSMLSWLSDGTFLVTTNDKPKPGTPTGYRLVRLPNASIKELFNAHENRLKSVRRENPPRCIS